MAQVHGKKKSLTKFSAKMLYKYLFYAVSYYEKKYDHIWNVGETYYVGGGMTVGMVISLSIINLIDIIGAYFFHERLLIQLQFLKYLPLVLGLSITVYLGYSNRHLHVYKEIVDMNAHKRRKYKYANILHLLFVFLTFFNMRPILEFFKLLE